jgi:hypothetical protein
MVRLNRIEALRWLTRCSAALVLAASAWTCCWAADAAPVSLTGTDGDRVLLQTSLFSYHFHYDTRHNNHQDLVDLEYWRTDGWLAGAAWFRNSFFQPTQYLYAGRLWRPLDTFPDAYVKLTGGLIHGYSGQYRDKIPFNGSGVAPALIPSLGWSYRRFNTELILFGTNGIMLNVGLFLD